MLRQINSRHANRVMLDEQHPAFAGLDSLQHPVECLRHRPEVVPMHPVSAVERV